MLYRSIQITTCILGFLGYLCNAQAQLCTPPPPGMVAWYTADGSANDSVGSNNGTLENGATFAPGEVGPAFSLNGINQFVALPANFIPYPSTGSTSVAPMSFDAWFETTTGGVVLGQQGAVLPPAIPSGAVPAVYVGTDGFLYVEFFWNGTIAPMHSPARVNNGVFHHVAVTYDGEVTSTYLDGALIGLVPFTQTGYAASYQYQVGAGYTAAGWPAGNGGYYYFQGLIDEVEFFHRALSLAEIEAIVAAGRAGKCKISTPGGCVAPPAGMVAWYTADGNANDFFGQNNGTLQNGATFASGKVGMAFSLNGVNQFVSLPANFVPYPATGAASTASMSVDAWFLTTTGGVILGQQSVVSPPAVPSGAVPAVYVGTDGLLHAELFWKGAIAPISSPIRINDGVFHHVAVTYDGVNEAVYLDGALIGAAPFTQTGYASSYQYQIGAGYTAGGWPASNGGYYYFQGLIDEVEFFNRALSQGEIMSIVNAGSAGKCRNHPPVALCKNVTVSAVSACTANASIDNGSFSPDPGDTITLNQSPRGPYPAGTTMVTLTVTDDEGASSQCTGTVTVTTTATSKIGAVAAKPNSLWPPNHKMIPVTLAVNAAGDCSGAAFCHIVSVSSNEPATAGDWVITGNLTVNLRAERSGKGSGRVYTITVQCTDAAGNISTKTVTVTVAHDHGNKGDGNGDDNGDGNGHGNGGGNENNHGGDQGQNGNGDGNGNGHGNDQGGHH